MNAPTLSPTPVPTPAAQQQFDWSDFEWTKLGNKAACASTEIDGRLLDGTFNSAIKCQLACQEGCFGMEYHTRQDTCIIFESEIPTQGSNNRKKRCYAKMFTAPFITPSPTPAETSP